MPSDRLTTWLEDRINAAHEDADAHPEGDSNRAFYRGQAIAYENALSASADRSPQGGDAAGGSVHEGAVDRQAETPEPPQPARAAAGAEGIARAGLDREALREKARAIAEAAANRWDTFTDTAGICWLADQILALAQAPAPRGGDEGWELIETAPRERQPILVAGDAGRYGDIRRAPAIAYWSESAGDWRHWNGEAARLDWTPVKWRPLPAPPSDPFPNTAGGA